MGKIKELLIKYKELVLYVVFGVLTTVVSYASYWIFTDFLHIPYMVSTALSWVLSVTFAYVTNRKWVFESRAHGFGEEAKRRQMLGAYLLSSGVYDKYYYPAQQVRTLITQDYKGA